MSLRSSQPARWTWFSPWMIIGSVCILAGILLVLVLKNVHREKEFMMKALLSEADILMRSLEASSRTGMRGMGMGMGWGQRQLQWLMEETAQQPDVLYVALVTAAGEIVAHSDPDQVGKTVPFTEPETGQTIYHFLGGQQQSFEVTRAYQPWFMHGGRGFHRGPRHLPQRETQREEFLLVGLDPAPFDAARRQDLHQTLLLFGMMFLVGAAGFISLVWAQHYRAARRSLQDVQAFTSTIVNQMPVGLIAVDRNGQIQRTNDAARQIMRLVDQPGHIDRFPCFVPIVRQLKSAETIVEQEVQCPLNESETIPLLVNAAVIRDSERLTTGYVFLFTDITNIKQLEEQLRRSERLAALGRLAAGIAHEIRNPLSSIKGFATILAGRFKDDESGRKVAHVMAQEVERLNHVVTELLDFARPTELQKRPYSCLELIQHTVRLVESDAMQQGVETESRVVPEDLQILVDPDRFAQVLLNLYLNALQAMEHGGRLTIEAMQQGDQVVMKVTDSGAGIPPEHLPHVFDPYFTTKPRGVGLGLANVHKLVEAHGGDIEVLSSPRQGTCVVVSIPASTRATGIAAGVSLHEKSSDSEVS